MKLKKVLTLIIIVIISCGFITSCNSYEKNIIKTVKKNQELLNQVPNEIKNFSNYGSIRITKNSNSNTKVFKDVFDLGIIKHIDTDFNDKRFNIFFYCYGEGFGSAMSYYGFYYTEDNLPIGWEGWDVNFTAKGDGWTAEEPDSYYTEMITEKWFYYEIHW